MHDHLFGSGTGVMVSVFVNANILSKVIISYFEARLTDV